MAEEQENKVMEHTAQTTDAQTFICSCGVVGGQIEILDHLAKENKSARFVTKCCGGEVLAAAHHLDMGFSTGTFCSICKQRQPETERFVEVAA